jgi:hypothetical protein
MQKIDSKLDFDFDGKQVVDITCDIPHDKDSMQVFSNIGEYSDETAIKNALSFMGYDKYTSAVKTFGDRFIVVAFGVKQ